MRWFDKILPWVACAIIIPVGGGTVFMIGYMLYYTIFNMLTGDYPDPPLQ